VVDTRSPRQAPELDVLLEERGACPLPYPCIDVAPALDPAPLEDALTRAAAGAFDWLVFTSANAVEAVEGQLGRSGIAAKQMNPISVAAVGPATAAAVAERLGLAVALCPQEHVAEALAEELVARGARRVLVPQAERAREVLVRILVENGVQTDAVVAYRTVLGSGGVDVPGLLREGRVDVVVFASPSAVENMAVRFGREDGDWDALKRVCIACVGPVTAVAAERRGLDVHVRSSEHTMKNLVDSLEQYYRSGPRRDKSRIGEQAL
jgi:uroporphyrinogen-III synthase